jgi:hypothetical protein
MVPEGLCTAVGSADTVSTIVTERGLDAMVITGRQPLV